MPMRRGGLRVVFLLAASSHRPTVERRLVENTFPAPSSCRPALVGPWGARGSFSPEPAHSEGQVAAFSSPLPRQAHPGAIWAVGEGEGEETRRPAFLPLWGALAQGLTGAAACAPPGPCSAARRSWRQCLPVPPHRAASAKEDDFSP